MTIKGYPSFPQSDSSIIHQQYPSVNPVLSYASIDAQGKNVTSIVHGLTTLSNIFCRLIASDTAEANTTAYYIKASSHSARIGDIIRVTSGTYDDSEFSVIAIPDANTIEISANLSTAITTGITFDILRFQKPIIDAAGNVSFALSFNRDGSSQAVIEDTATPANNRPLPVKLFGDGIGPLAAGSGIVGSTVLRTTPASDSPHLLATRHETATTPLATRLGDGTDFFSAAALTAAQQTVSTFTKAPYSHAILYGWDGTTHREVAVDGGTGVVQVNTEFSSPTITAAQQTFSSGSGAISARSIDLGWDGTQHKEILLDSGGIQYARPHNGTAAADFGSGTVASTTIRTTPATDSPHLLATRHETATTPLAAQISNGSAFASFGSGTNASTVLRVTPATDAPHLLATRHEAAATPLAVYLSNGSSFSAYGSGVVGATVLRTTPATDSPHLLATRHETVTTPLASRLSDGTDFITAAAIAASHYTVSTVAKALHTISNIVGWDGTTHREIAVDTNGNLSFSPGGLSAVDKATIDASSSNITSSAYVQLDASLASGCKEIEIYNGTGQPLIFATGAAASESEKIYVFPGGNGRVPLAITAATRTALKAVSTSATTGEVYVNFYG